jgi:hypothetical protein
MNHNLPHTIALLARTPATLNALLRDLPDDWTVHNEGGETFNVRDVVGHLIYGDRVDWLARTRMILDFGESRPFEPFDRRGHERECADKTLPALLDEFARVRSATLSELRSLNLQPEQLVLRGCHPTFGAVTLSQLLATWAATTSRTCIRSRAFWLTSTAKPWVRGPSSSACFNATVTAPDVFLRLPVIYFFARL